MRYADGATACCADRVRVSSILLPLLRDPFDPDMPSHFRLFDDGCACTSPTAAAVRERLAADDAAAAAAACVISTSDSASESESLMLMISEAPGEKNGDDE
jgi:hypothetical protein